MTFADIVLIIIWIAFIAMGARVGSLWTGSCVLAGFFGSFLADYYAYPLSTMLGFSGGSILISEVLLFFTGVISVVLPGWILSKISNVVFLGLIDSAMGFVTGAITGLVAIALCLLVLVPIFPRIEKTKSWKSSRLAKPYHNFLETVFNEPQFRPGKLGKKIRKNTINRIGDALGDVRDSVKDKAENAVQNIKN